MTGGEDRSGFDALQLRLSRLQAVDDQVRWIGGRLDELNRQLYTHFSLVDARFDVIRGCFTDIRPKLGTIYELYSRIDGLLGALRQAPDGREAPAGEDGAAEADPLFAEIEEELSAVQEMLDRIDRQLAALRSPFPMDDPDRFEIVCFPRWPVS